MHIRDIMKISLMINVQTSGLNMTDRPAMLEITIFNFFHLMLQSICDGFRDFFSWAMCASNLNDKLTHGGKITRMDAPGHVIIAIIEISFWARKTIIRLNA